MNKAFDEIPNEILQFIDEKSCAFVYREPKLFGNLAKEYLIVIHNDSTYESFSNKLKNVVIGHELGHIYNRKADEKLSSEERADAYVKNKYGKLTVEESRTVGSWLDSFYNSGNILENAFIERFSS
jgi:hypothetical protein